MSTAPFSLLPDCERISDRVNTRASQPLLGRAVIGRYGQTVDDERGAATHPGRWRDVCPICGGPNECGGAMGKDHCWCSSVEISPNALASVPADARERICICPSCAGTRARA